MQISQGIRVRSSKSQTTPRLGLERGESAIQIAPPVRAGPSSRNRRSYSPDSASTVSISSTSEVLSSTPIPSAELVDRSQNTSVTPMATTEPTNTQPYSSVETQATLTSVSFHWILYLYRVCCVTLLIIYQSIRFFEVLYYKFYSTLFYHSIIAILGLSSASCNYQAIIWGHQWETCFSTR